VSIAPPTIFGQPYVTKIANGPLHGHSNGRPELLFRATRHFIVHGMVAYPDGKPVTCGTVEFELIAGKNPNTASLEKCRIPDFRPGIL